MDSNEITSTIKVVFGTPHGEKLIKYLKATLVDRPMYKQGLTLDEVAFRQGQADVINQLLKEIDYGN